MSFDFDENQHRFERDQYAETVGAGVLEKKSLRCFLFNFSYYEIIIIIITRKLLSVSVYMYAW